METLQTFAFMIDILEVIMLAVIMGVVVWFFINMWTGKMDRGTDKTGGSGEEKESGTDKGAEE